MEPLYVFIDESGDFNFTPSGTKYYIFTAVITHNPNELVEEFNKLKHLILSKKMLTELGMGYLEENIAHKFHATEDVQVVRDEVFSIISELKLIKVHSVVAQKNKVNPSITKPQMFYPKTLTSLLAYILKSYKYSKLVVVVDGRPTQQNRQAFLKGIKEAIKEKAITKDYLIYCPPSESNYFLQVADYINWAICRKWELEDLRSFNYIKKFLDTSEKDIYERGTTLYYKYKK